MKVAFILTEVETEILKEATSVYDVQYVGPDTDSEGAIANESMKKELIRAWTRKTARGKVSTSDWNYLNNLQASLITLSHYDYADYAWAHSQEAMSKMCLDLFGRLDKESQAQRAKSSQESS